MEKPIIHEVVNVQWREIPADLTLPCPKQVIVAGMTYGEAIEAWSRDRTAIDTCNGRLAGIATLGETDDGT